MDAKMITAVSQVQLFNALADLGDTLEAAGWNDVAAAARMRALDALKHGAKVIAGTDT